ncbi:carboxylesterase [Roridomyces roridus]|uniref:Carboxylesterase n=1 Tax=Roridomyces roridus TaxID=1738132 RepID=A0AAD7AZ44_9AGAR|nr:carboxylesterase [Roridomyces roridus]
MHYYLPTAILLSVLFTAVNAVTTSSGDIFGHPASKSPSVIEYLGIPYAQAPVGELRFAPPVGFATTEIFKATDFVPIPYPNKTDNFNRIVDAFLGQGAVFGEDCLTLNVWAKNSTELGRAVMVFFYGGRFDIGGTNSPFYNGQYLADSEDIVVITVNYRTNIFGFPGAPQTTQNLGLLDQRLALEWVRSNAAAFAGDPARITIFGQSAGGIAVDYHAFAFADDPIAAGVIAQSGTALSLAANTPEVALGHWTTASGIIGCASDGDDPAVVMQCMRSKNFSQILAAEAQIVTAGDPTLLPSPPFQPTVDNITVFADYLALSEAGQFAKLPYLVGSTDNEAGLYRVPALAFGLSISDSQWDLFNLAGFTCPASRSALSRSTAGVPTWRYRYFGDWDNLRLFPGSGAYHGSELEMVFGTAEDVSGEASGVQQEGVSGMMRQAWGAFAKDPRAGLTALGWPQYEPNTLVRIAFEDEETVSLVNPSVYDEPCSTLGDSLSAAQGAF